ncbi:979_t:CDS:2 [Ambispora leptoticha]|uniref:979_t:CDS:1 n=1 Tax=Ambispora leptoticha TaxID=144679 RepID=A0A9N9AGT5_9GLOM|nr:979_t:CDS:2 [Ambispora leptoticha]
MTHLIVKRCADEIEERGLHEVDIFKPIRIGENAAEVKDLINCMLQDNRMQFEDEIKNQNIHNVVAAMKWALRHCEVTLVPYMFYEEFVRFEQEWDFDPEKGSFSQFLLYLPKQNQEILLCLFDICAKVTEESHINQMSAQKIVKSLALCVLGDQERKFDTFDDAYSEYSKCSNACLHLFLAYLREKAVATRLPPRLTVFLDNINYLDVRKKSVASMYIHPQTLNRQTYTSSILGDDSQANNSQYAESYLSQSDIEEGLLPPSNSNYAESTTSTITKDTYQKSPASDNYERPTSILRVTRTMPVQQQPGQNQNFNSRKSKAVSILLPEMVDNLNRQTIVRASTLMTADEQKTAQTLWKEFQTEGVSGFSDDFLKLFFSLDDREELYASPPLSPSTVASSPLSDAAEKPTNTGIWSINKNNNSNNYNNYNDYKNNNNNNLYNKNTKDNKSRNNIENENNSLLQRSPSELDKYKPVRGPRPITAVWNSFREFGFDGLIGGIGNKKDPKVEQLLGYNDSNRIEHIEEIQDNDSNSSEQRPHKKEWNNFKDKGFGDLASDNISDALSLSNASITSPAPSIFNKDLSPSVAPSIAPSVFSNDASASVFTSKSRKTARSGKSFGSRQRQMSDEERSVSTATRTVEEMQNWHMIDRKIDFPSTTHLAIEAIDEIFPYVWMENTAAEDKDGYWGDWVFIEPRKGLLNECEWIMIENQHHVFGNDWGNPDNYRQFSKRRSKLGFSWIRRSFVSRRSSQSIYQAKVKRFNTVPNQSNNNSFNGRFSKGSTKSSKSKKSKKKGKSVEGLPPNNYANNGKLHPNAGSYSRNDVKLMPNENNGRNLDRFTSDRRRYPIDINDAEPQKLEDSENNVSSSNQYETGLNLDKIIKDIRQPLQHTDNEKYVSTETSQENSNIANETSQEISQEQDQQFVETPKKESAPIYKLSQNATPRLLNGNQNDKTKLKQQGSQRYKYIDIPKTSSVASSETKNKSQPYPTANNNMPSEQIVSTQQSRPQISRSNTETKFSRSNEKIQASNSQENISQPSSDSNKELPMNSQQISAQQKLPYNQNEMMPPSIEQVQPQRQASRSNEQIQPERQASRRQPYPQTSNPQDLTRSQKSLNLNKELPLSPQGANEQIQSQPQPYNPRSSASRSNERIQPEVQASRSNEQILLQRDAQHELQDSRLNERVQSQRQASRSNERIQPQGQASSSQERIKQLPSSSSDSNSQSQSHSERQERIQQLPQQQIQPQSSVQMSNDETRQPLFPLDSALQQQQPVIQNEKLRPYGNDEKSESYSTDAKLQAYANDVKLQPFPNNAKVQSYPKNAPVAESTYAADDILSSYARSEISGTPSDAGSIYSNDQRDNNINTPKKFQGYQTTSQRLAAQASEKAAKHMSVSSTGSTAPVKPARSVLRTKVFGS